MKKRRLLFVAVAAAAAAVLIVIGVTSAYFTEVEVKENNITIGNVSVKLDEGSFDPDTTHPVVPGSVTEKAPKVKNDGNKDEFVFMKITVPKKAVTLLWEDGENRGKPKSDKQAQQLFRLSAETATPDSVAAVPAITGRDVAFSYHSDTAGGRTVDGWVLLESKTTGSSADEYVFGYNKKMLPNAETVTLFDSVQLKSFLDAEATGGTEIGVICYGIQAENLKPVNPVDLTKNHYSLAELQNIYTIVKNKAGGQQ